MRKGIIAALFVAAMAGPTQGGIRPIGEPVAIMTKEQTHTFWGLYRLHPALAQAYFNWYESYVHFIFAPSYPNMLCQVGYCHAECITTESRYIDIDPNDTGRFFGIDLRGYPDGDRQTRTKVVQFPRPITNEEERNGDDKRQ